MAAFNEAAAIQLRMRQAGDMLRKLGFAFNEAAAIQLRMLTSYSPIPPGVPAFNEAAAIQLRMLELIRSDPQLYGMPSMRPQRFSCGCRPRPRS